MTNVLRGLINGGATNIREINQFNSDIRECKESEAKRVKLERVKIHERFITEKGQRKEHVWKLLFIHILG